MGDDHSLQWDAHIGSVAYDGAGNVGTSADASVNVQNNVAVTTDTTPPAAQITSPVNGATTGAQPKGQHRHERQRRRRPRGTVH
jgi:hypothetical protein